jgi:glycogen debranching enzyme
LNHIEKINSQLYILATSSLTDDRTMVLKHGESLGVFDRYGDVQPIGQGVQGIYHRGTRFLSKLELLINDQRPIMLSSDLKDKNDMLAVDLSNPEIQNNDTTIQSGTLHIHRRKFIWNDAAYEKIDLCNFNIEPMSFSLQLNFDADFRDIFEVRGTERNQRGTNYESKDIPGGLQLSYMGIDKIKRQTTIIFPNNQPHKTLENGVEFNIVLAPKENYQIVFNISFEVNENKPQIENYDSGYKKLNKYLSTNSTKDTEIISSSDQFNRWLNRSKYDMAFMISETDNGIYPYAGVPWYSVPFGRDGIITAWECLWLYPDLTKGVLTYLSKTQAKELDSFNDAEPGKIFHEKREGEMAELGEIPFKMYYGSIDGTPLYIGLAGAYYERTGDIDFIKSIWANIEMALEWIDNYGDMDGDGFVEYIKKSENGLFNQGWKDSHDSIYYENGEIAKGPIALCEVQGYVYEAKLAASNLARKLGFTKKSDKLCKEAIDLKDKFQKAFWSKDKNTFVIALDGKKKQCNINSSNAGHCLFSGIVPKSHSQQIANNLVSEKMFSGWGIRTIAMDESRYNPMSYHNGSIWPHDNAIIAFGLAKYGHKKEVNKIFEAMFDMSIYFQNQRLPELFCGFEKRENQGPTEYPVACSPQAWSIGSVYMILQACLGIRIAAEDNIIYFYNPTLPDSIDEITLSNLCINESKFVVQITRTFKETKVLILYKEGNAIIEVVNDRLLIDDI